MDCFSRGFFVFRFITRGKITIRCYSQSTVIAISKLEIYTGEKQLLKLRGMAVKGLIRNRKFFLPKTYLSLQYSNRQHFTDTLNQEKLLPKASDEVILQNICSWGYVLLEYRICSYKILKKLS